VGRAASSIRAVRDALPATTRFAYTYAICVYCLNDLEFIEAPSFARFVDVYLRDADFRALQSALVGNPEAGDVIAGTGGFRKYRWRDASRSKGKRGGLRVVYYYFAEDQQIWFVAVYDKNDVADLTPAEKKHLKAAISTELGARRKTRERQKRL
jgi:hypothetical protein